MQDEDLTYSKNVTTSNEISYMKNRILLSNKWLLVVTCTVCPENSTCMLVVCWLHVGYLWQIVKNQFYVSYMLYVSFMLQS